MEPGQATIRYSMPMPEDSPLGKRETEALGIEEGVLDTVHDGWLGMEGSNLRFLIQSQASYHWTNPQSWPAHRRAHLQY